MMNSRFAPAIHVRFEGRSQRLNAAELGLAANAGDSDIKHAVARVLQMAPSRFTFHVVERHDDGNISVRPQTISG